MHGETQRSEGIQILACMNSMAQYIHLCALWPGSNLSIVSIFTIHFSLCLKYLELDLCQSLPLSSQCRIYNRTEHHCSKKSQIQCITYLSTYMCVSVYMYMYTF